MPLVAALPELGGELLLALALVVLFMVYYCLYLMRSYAPHWSIVGQGIDMRPWFDGPLRLVESWMHSLEALMEKDAKIVWTLIEETGQLFVELFQLAYRDVISPVVATAISEVSKVAEGAASDIKGINATLYHGAEGLANRVGVLVHDVSSIGADVTKLVGRVDALEKVAYKGATGLEATITKEVESAVHAAISGALHDVGVLRGDVTEIDKKIAAFTAVLTPAVLRDLPDLERLLKGLGHVADLPGEVLKLAGQVGALERAIGSIPADATKLWPEVGELLKTLEWVKPLIAVGAITGALEAAWRLMRDGECPCPQLPPISFNGAADAIIADLVVKDGI